MGLLQHGAALMLLLLAWAGCVTLAGADEIPATVFAEGETTLQRIRRLEPMEGASATANLCQDLSAACFEETTCRTCILLGSITSDALTPSKCSDARGAFFNAYNGSTSETRNLKCNPYNTQTALGAYMECVWKSGPCGMSAAAGVKAGALALAGVLLGVLLVR